MLDKPSDNAERAFPTDCVRRFLTVLAAAKNLSSAAKNQPTKGT